MMRNMSSLDRGFRAAAGLALIVWALLSEHPLHGWGLVGLVPLATAAVGFCPLYQLLGISTCRRAVGNREGRP